MRRNSRIITFNIFDTRVLMGVLIVTLFLAGGCDDDLPGYTGDSGADSSQSDASKDGLQDFRTEGGGGADANVEGGSSTDAAQADTAQVDATPSDAVLDGPCAPNSSRSCYTGKAGTEGKGICKAGTQQCTSGVWGKCVGETHPAKEACDGLDDDCNGLVDDWGPQGLALCFYGELNAGGNRSSGGSLELVSSVGFMQGTSKSGTMELTTRSVISEIQ